MHHRRRRHDTDRSRSDISRAAAAAAAIAAAAAAAPLSAAYAFDEEESMTLEDNIHARAREADRADLHGARHCPARRLNRSCYKVRRETDGVASSDVGLS